MQRVQELYEECQASFNPRNLMALLQRYPYHIDALLTMSDVHRSMGEGEYADKLLEMCLYALERGWPGTFIHTLNSGNGIEIPYSGHNIPLFIALGRYIQILGRRGLHRTALECCKLLLSLNAEDPCGALFTIDYFALRCRQYRFLKQFADYYDDGGISTMPNIVYSLALASWFEETEKRESHEESSTLLAKALMLHPAALSRLEKKLQSMNVGSDSRWTSVLSSSPFVNATLDDRPSLERLVDIFVERQHLLWKSAQVQDWLLQQAERVASAARLSHQGQSQTLPYGLSIADWAAIREQAFQPGEMNEYAHLKVHEFSDTVAQLPAEEIHGIDQDHGANIGLEEEQLAMAMAQDLAEGPTNPLTAFLRSILPWENNLGQQPDYTQTDDSHDNGQEEE